MTAIDHTQQPATAVGPAAAEPGAVRPRLAATPRPGLRRAAPRRPDGADHAGDARAGHQGDRQPAGGARSPRSARSRCCCWSTSPGRSADRVRSQALLGVACVGLISLGTLASQTTWIAVVGMAIVAFVVLFSAVVSSVHRQRDDLAAAGVHPARLAAGPGVADSGPDRRLGDGGGRVGDRDRGPVAAPRPATRSGSRRSPAAARSRRGSAREVAFIVARGAAEAAAGLPRRRSPRPTTPCPISTGPSSQTPYRPTGLTTSDRAVVRLVDDLRWCNGIVLHAQAAAHPHVHTPNPRVIAVKQCRRGGAGPLCRVRCRRRVIRARRWTRRWRRCTRRWPRSRPRRRASCPRRRARGARSTRCPTRVVSALDPSFRAQELSFVVMQIGANTGVAGGRRAPGLGGARARPAAAGVHRTAVVGRASARGRTWSRARSGCTTASAARWRSRWRCSSPTSRTSSTASGSRSARCRCCAPTRSLPARTRSGRWSGPPPAS